MRLNRKFILLIILFLFTSPLYSFTWKEFLDSLASVAPDKYDFPKNAKNKKVTCWKIASWEIYVEGDSSRSGYVKRNRKEIKIDCPY